MSSLAQTPEPESLQFTSPGTNPVPPLAKRASTLLLVGFLTSMTLVNCTNDATVKGVTVPVKNTKQQSIVGGTGTRQGDYPWVASLQSSSGWHFCGGSLIAPQWVVSAAHCNLSDLHQIEINAAKHGAEEGEVFGISAVVVHPGYHQANDIMLIKLDRPAKTAAVAVNQNIEYPIASHLGFAAPDQVTRSIGWGGTYGYDTFVCHDYGDTKEDCEQLLDTKREVYCKAYSSYDCDFVMNYFKGQHCTDGLDFEECTNIVSMNVASETLLQVDLPIVHCNEGYNQYFGLDDTHICAGGVAGNSKGSCQGDSGGPLIAQKDGKSTLLGVVSRGVGCALSAAPGIYTRVSSYISWFNQVTDNALVSDAPPTSTPVCGNAIEEEGETCDDGNQNNNDACLNTCKNPSCGDGFVQTGVEQCDDSNSSNTDACLNTCKNPSCGDGYVQAGVEQCDDSNSSNTDACLNSCKNPSCGDGYVQAGVEQCDDSNSSNTDACLNTCKNPSCGDGFIRAGVEQCDDSNSSNTDACLNTCKNPSCGDGFVQEGIEECDDSNSINTDGCLDSCQIVVCAAGTTITAAGTCEADPCPSVTVPNSDRKDSPIIGSIGDTAQVTCDSGYQGGGTWTCGTNGLFTGEPCSACPTMAIDIIGDYYPGETSWTVWHNGSEMARGDVNGKTLELCEGGSYEFQINDNYGDGICCKYGEGSYTISLDGEVVGRGGEFTFMDTVSLDLDKNLELVAPKEVTCKALEIKIEPDYYPFETRWFVTRKDKTVANGKASGGTVTLCEAGDYKFTITDSYGDGICCNYGIGSYRINYDGAEVGTGSEFKWSETHPFSLDKDLKMTLDR